MQLAFTSLQVTFDALQTSFVSPTPFLVLAVILALLGRVYKARSLPLPPPPDLKKNGQSYPLMTKEAGEIVSVKKLGKPTIILNSYQAAYDLLEKRSSIYSDRPHYVMLRDLMAERGTALQPYGDTWRKHRKLYQQNLNQAAVKTFIPLQTATAQQLLKLFYKSPDDFIKHVRYVAASLVVQVSYGPEIVQSKFEEYVKLSHLNSAYFLLGAEQERFLVNTIPLLKHMPTWFPGAGFQKLAREARASFQKALDMPFIEAKRQFLSGGSSKCFIADELAKVGTTDESLEEVDLIKTIAASIAEGGTETTTSTLLWFILAMVLFPEAQRKAQEELDKVLGQDRLPLLSDRPNLPYLDALHKEVFRWYPTVISGVAHRTTVEDIYNNYLIPANTTIISNTWSILHDPDVYPEPYSFKPERFLPGNSSTDAIDPRVGGTFGWGRRICPGRHFADGAIWISIASILSVFDISKAVDEHGSEIDVHYAKEFSPTAILITPKNFPCTIKPRSRDGELLLTQLLAESS